MTVPCCCRNSRHSQNLNGLDTLGDRSRYCSFTELLSGYERLRLLYTQLYDWNAFFASETAAIRERNSALSLQVSGQADLIQQLRRSHATVMSQLATLSRTVEINAEIAASFTSRNRFSHHVGRRVLANISVNFTAMLASHSTALCRRPVAATEFTAITTEQNKSEPTDCSPLELQAVLAALRSRDQVLSRCEPSAYDIDFADAATADKLAIHFKDFASMCDCLNVPVPQRAKGLYRERRTRDRNISMIQLIATAVRTPSDSTTKVVIGSSDLSCADSATVLFHDAPVWHTVDWDRGFQLTTEHRDSSSFIELEQQLNASASDVHGFQLFWFRKKAQPTVGLSSLSADAAQGRLEARIPLVLIRGRKLIDSARTHLGSPDSPSSTVSTLCHPDTPRL